MRRAVRVRGVARRARVAVLFAVVVFAREPLPPVAPLGPALLYTVIRLVGIG